MKKLILITLLALLSNNTNAEIISCKPLRSIGANTDVNLDRTFYFNINRITGTVIETFDAEEPWTSGLEFLRNGGYSSDENIAGNAIIYQNMIVLQGAHTEVTTITNDFYYDFKTYITENNSSAQYPQGTIYYHLTGECKILR